MDEALATNETLQAVVVLDHQEMSERDTRGSGPGSRRKRSDAMGPRKDVMIRMPEELAKQLKIAAAHEETTVTDFCLQAITPQVKQALAKHGLEIT